MIEASLLAWLPAGAHLQSQTPSSWRADLPQRVENLPSQSRNPKEFVAANICVSSQPSLICARTPFQAHHLRFAQPRALGRKVLDEFTFPLCATHHHELHMRGNEKEWWIEKNVEPLAVADGLWRNSSDT
jgi:hypothetical protein